MVQIGSTPGIDVRHQVQHPVPLQHALSSFDGDVVPRLDIDLSIDLDVRVDHDHVAHFAGANVMHVAHARRLAQRLADRGDFLFVDRTVHQVVQCIPAEAPAHLRHHEADDERGDRIEDRIPRQVADDAQAHHE